MTEKQKYKITIEYSDILAIERTKTIYNAYAWEVLESCFTAFCLNGKESIVPMSMIKGIDIEKEEKDDK